MESLPKQKFQCEQLINEIALEYANPGLVDRDFGDMPLERAQAEDAVQIQPAHRRHPIAAAGGQDQVVIGQMCAVRRFDDAAVAVDAHGAGLGTVVDAFRVGRSSRRSRSPSLR